MTVSQLLARLGLHREQMSLFGFVSKILGVASLITGGFLNPAAILFDGFGLHISDVANARIKWWAAAIGAVVTYVTSQNTDQYFRPAPKDSPETMRGPSITMFAALALAGAVSSSCAPKTWQPSTQRLYNTDQVVRGLADLQHFAITLGESGEISLQDSAFVVDGVQTLLDGVEQAGLGWGASVRASLTGLVGDADARPPISPRLREPALSKLRAYIRGVLLLLQELERLNPAAARSIDPVRLAGWRAALGAERHVFYIRHGLRPATQ